MKHLKNMSLILALGLLFLGGTMMAKAEESAVDCGHDPVYEREFSGQLRISANLRDVACMTGSKVLRTISQGKVVKVIAETDGWYKVKDNDGTIGWVGAKLIEATDKEVSEIKKEVKAESKESKKEAKAEAKEAKKDSKVTANTKGYILLQVEQKGEAWYVNPEDSYRYFLKDGDSAFKIMKDLGLGISNQNLEKLKAKNQDLLNKLKGRIVLQVEKNGEAYYVDPKDGVLHYLKNGWEAFKVMKNLSLGAKNIDIAKIKERGVEEYKKIKEELKKKVEKVKEEVTNRDGVIKLSGKADSTGQVTLNWVTKNLDAKQGFKVVISSKENPVYPGNDYHYLTDPGVRSDVWENLKAGTYHFRVCEYLGGKCGAYSNNVKLEVYDTEADEDGEEEEVEDDLINLTGTVNSEGIAVLSWSLKDMTSKMGFKVVVSDKENPVYPGNDYHYLTNANTRSDSWSGLNAGTHYFRVCEYLGGKCGVYSNNLKLEF